MKALAPSPVATVCEAVAPDLSAAGPPRVLLVDPDAAWADTVARLLADGGMQVSRVESAEAAEARLAAEAADLVILETALPGEDGLSLCRRLSRQATTPVVMLTARCELMDRVVGLEFGADDYLGKDCHPLELMARVRAVIRRRRAGPPRGAAPAHGRDLAWRGWRLDTARRRLVAPGGEEVSLSQSEAQVLAGLFARPEAVFSRAELRRLVDPTGAPVGPRTMDTMMCRLRRTIERHTGARLFVSFRGVGYALGPIA